jgi:hypothetical protein
MIKNKFKTTNYHTTLKPKFINNQLILTYMYITTKCIDHDPGSWFGLRVMIWSMGSWFGLRGHDLVSGVMIWSLGSWSGLRGHDLVSSVMIWSQGSWFGLIGHDLVWGHDLVSGVMVSSQGSWSGLRGHDLVSDVMIWSQWLDIPGLTTLPEFEILIKYMMIKSLVGQIFKTLSTFYNIKVILFV